MNDFSEALAVMRRLFTTDCQFAMATAQDNVPSLRYVDTYLYEDCFFIVTYGKSRKVREAEQNPRVALCSRQAHAFSGMAKNLGHPCNEENRAIREALVQAFAPWYFKHNNENDPAMCILRIEPETGFFHRDGIGYQVDFVQRTAKAFPFVFDTVITEG